GIGVHTQATNGRANGGPGIQAESRPRRNSTISSRAGFACGTAPGMLSPGGTARRANSCICAIVGVGLSAYRVIESWSYIAGVRSTHGLASTCARSGRPASLARIAASAVIAAPVLSPNTAARVASTPQSGARSTTCSSTSQPSSAAADGACSSRTPSGGRTVWFIADLLIGYDGGNEVPVDRGH